MANPRKHHPDRPASVAERVAAFRARKREAELEARRHENFKRAMLEDDVRDQVDEALDFLQDLYSGEDTPVGAVVGQLDDPEIKRRLRQLLFEAQIRDYEPVLREVDPEETV